MRIDDGISVLALSPPEFEHNLLPDNQRMSSVNSSTPYALMATLSRTFQVVRDGVLNVLNWSSPESIRDSVFLIHYWQQEQGVLEEKMLRLKPDIIFMGTFAMNFPGAIAAASLAKKINPEVLVILGGRHIGESFWSDVDTREKTVGTIYDHPEANPIRLMQSKIVPRVFDLVISGQGQDLIPALIGACQKVKKRGDSLSSSLSEIVSQVRSAPGYWTIGQFGKNGIAYTQPDTYRHASVQDIHSPYMYAGVDGVHFPVFDKSDWTAHVHSDSQGTSGNSCTQNCHFCSEASSKNLKITHEIDAANRLWMRFQEIIEIGGKAGKKTSIFVEDSILCGGNFGAIERFCDLLEDAQLCGSELPQEWGCQFTVPMILNAKGDAIIRRLGKCGLSYIYFGLESAKPEIAKSIAKSSKVSNWSFTAETAVANLTEMGIKVGTSNIFCMGETQNDRMNQLQLIQSWQQKYRGNPCVYSLNLQTVHPGEWNREYIGPKYDFTHWGLYTDDPRSPILQRLFGEASVRYLRQPQESPTLEELIEIYNFLFTINNKV